MSYEYDFLAFIGRVGPFHKGHKEVLERGLAISKRVGMVLGSDGQPRSARNPWTTAERVEMITRVFPDEVKSGRIVFLPQEDHPYNMDRWIAEVRAKVTTAANTPFTPDPIKIGLIGHSKDHSSFYLKSFPNWGSVEVPNYKGINATEIREDFFLRGALSESSINALPKGVVNFLYGWRDVANLKATSPLDDTEWSEDYKTVREEYKFVNEYKRNTHPVSDETFLEWVNEHAGFMKGFTGAIDVMRKFASVFTPKYAPVFFTADAVVIQSGHVLLVKRGAMPGKGLWALPGGFVNPHEDSKDAALRELKEETKIDVPLAVLQGSIALQRLFQDPYRSQRGRTLTVAYLIRLRPDENLPKVKGSDDAEKAVWVPISNLKRDAMFEDHYDICEAMIGF